MIVEKESDMIFYVTGAESAYKLYNREKIIHKFGENL